MICTGPPVAAGAQTGQAGAVAMLAFLDVPPSEDGVALLDATWQDYPRWEPDEAVAFKAPSLTHPQSPPYPGFAVATRSHVEHDHLIRVELWAETRPEGLRLLHTSVLYVGSAGVELGNAEDSLIHTHVPPGEWKVEIWVDRDREDTMRRVAFVLPHLRP